MSNTPTRTAVAGRFQSKTGEDLILALWKDAHLDIAILQQAKIRVCQTLRASAVDAD